MAQDQAAIGQAIGQISAESMTIAQAAPIQLERVDLQGKTRTFDALQYFAPSMAILFMTFAMAAGRDGHSQRIAALDASAHRHHADPALAVHGRETAAARTRSAWSR